MLKINTELTDDETQTLFDLLKDEIVEHGPEAKLKFLSGEISENHLNWHNGHRVYLIKLSKKLGFNLD